LSITELTNSFIFVSFMFFTCFYNVLHAISIISISFSWYSLVMGSLCTLTYDKRLQIYGSLDGMMKKVLPYVSF
jgi:hypothetical protein